MLMLAKSDLYWSQLLRSSPILAFLVVRCWHFDGQPEEGAAERIRRYIRQKRSGICAAMGFPSDQRTVRLVSRMQMCREGLVTHLLLLRALLRWESSARDILERGKHVTASQLSRLAIGENWSELFPWDNLQNAAWFFQLPAVRRFWLAQQYLTASRLSELQKAFMEPIKSLACFRSERKAVAYFVEYLKRKNAIMTAAKLLDRSIDGFAWPDPPVPLTETVIPVLSFAALTAEGKRMEHCVAEYAPRIVRGEYYVYRVEGSIPCTLGIQYTGGSWKIDQVKGARNEPVQDQSISKMLDDWLRSAPAQKRNSSARCEYLQEISKISGLSTIRALDWSPEL